MERRRVPERPWVSGRRGAGRGGDRVALGAHGLDPAAHGVDAVGDRRLDRLAVRHAAREVGELDQVAATLVLGQWPDGEAVGTPWIMLASPVDEDARMLGHAGAVPRSSEGRCIFLERAGDSFAGHWSVHRPPPRSAALPGCRGYGFPWSHGPPEQEVNRQWLIVRYRAGGTAGKDS
jgi:hypothetical protein